jgi:hypothetical protein
LADTGELLPFENRGKFFKCGKLSTMLPDPIGQCVKCGIVFAVRQDVGSEFWCGHLLKVGLIHSTLLLPLGSTEIEMSSPAMMTIALVRSSILTM